MMPRPILVKLFNLTYRKIPVLAIGHDVYCDTSIILEALEQQFPASLGYSSLYPRDATGRTNQALIRGFASFWTDRPFFRVTTGLIPGSVWRTSFGEDRAKLIGHKLDPEKLEKKLPQNLSNLDLQLSLFEDLFREADDEWVFWTPEPSLADISIWYQLNWGLEMAAGKGIYNLTGGGTEDTAGREGAESVFNKERYPATYLWFERFKVHMERLENVEKKISEEQAEKMLAGVPDTGPKVLPTPAKPHANLDQKNGLVPGATVSIAPDDTGRDE
jgi:glutathione S-transferase